MLLDSGCDYVGKVWVRLPQYFDGEVAGKLNQGFMLC
jgi:hypothetical protein